MFEAWGVEQARLELELEGEAVLGGDAEHGAVAAAEEELLLERGDAVRAERDAAAEGQQQAPHLQQRACTNPQCI
jgi:hypothetical protein